MRCDLYNSSYKHIISWFCLLAACTDWALEISSHWSYLNVSSDASKAKVINRGFCEDCGMVVRVKGYPQSLVVLRIGEGNWTFSQEAPHKEELQMCDWKIPKNRVCQAWAAKEDRWEACDVRDVRSRAELCIKMDGGHFESELKKYKQGTIEE